MIKDEIVKQREIGQQLIIIRIVHGENDKVIKGGVSFLGVSKIVEWTHKSEEEVVSLLEDIEALEEFTIRREAALEYAKKLSPNEYGFFLLTFKKYGDLYVEIVLGGGKTYNDFSEKIEYFAYINAREINDCGINVDEEIKSAARFEDALKFYFKFYVDRVAEVSSKGYDWDVICEMLRGTKKFTNLIRPLVDNKITEEI